MSYKKISKNMKRIFFFIALFSIFSGIMPFTATGKDQVSFDKEQFEIQSKVKKAKQMAVNWLKRNIREEGIFPYAYDPVNDTESTKNNAIRQLMASIVVSELALHDKDWKEIHKKNLDFLLQHWYREEGEFGYILYDGNSKLGSNAMMLRVLSKSPYFDDYREIAKKIAEGICSLQDENGAFKAFFVPPKYSYDEAYLLTFYSGEAILSLLEYYERVGELKYLEFAKKSQGYYREVYVTLLAENYYPAYVPWHTMALSKLYFLTGNKTYAESIFILNDELLKIQDKEKYSGRFHNPDHPEYGSPHSSSDGVYTEGLAYAYEIAKKRGDQAHRKKYRKALLLALKNLMSLQYTDKEVRQKGYQSEKVIGAIKINAEDERIRIDTTQHAIDAFQKALHVF